MSIIQVDCIDQILTIKNSPLIASGGVKEDFVKFSFDSNWTGFGKLAMFYRNGEETPVVYESAIASDGLCEIPHEVMSESGKICFGVTGVNGSDVRTSEILTYDIEKGSPRSGQTSEPAPTSVYNQMLAIAEEINTKASQIDSQVAAVQSAINTHANNATIHVTAEDKENWNGVQSIEKGGTGATTAETALTNLGGVNQAALTALKTQIENEMSYKAGDTITLNYISCIGRLTGNSGTIGAYIPLSKPLLNVTNATISNPDIATITVRAIDGYLWQGEKMSLVQESGTVTVKVWKEGLEIADANVSAWSTTNNTPLQVEFRNLSILLS